MTNEHPKHLGRVQAVPERARIMIRNITPPQLDANRGVIAAELAERLIIAGSEHTLGTTTGYIIYVVRIIRFPVIAWAATIGELHRQDASQLSFVHGVVGGGVNPGKVRLRLRRV